PVRIRAFIAVLGVCSLFVGAGAAYAAPAPTVTTYAANRSNQIGSTETRVVAALRSRFGVSNTQAVRRVHDQARLRSINADLNRQLGARMVGSYVDFRTGALT